MSTRRQRYFLLLNVFIFFTVGTTQAQEIHVVHFGDSITAAGYLPKENRIPSLVQKKLRKIYKNDSIICHNVSRGGGTIKKFMAKGGTYDKKCKAKITQMDLCIIHFGVNDEDAYSPEGFKQQYALMCDRLKKDYPGVTIALCTSMRTKSPGWWKRVGPDAEEPISKNYYSVTRKFAQANNYILIDIYNRQVKEMRKGKWDIHIRNSRIANAIYRKEIIDNSKDKERVGDGDKWFKNLHPNALGTEIIANLEVEILKKHFPVKLLEKLKK